MRPLAIAASLLLSASACSTRDTGDSDKQLSELRADVTDLRAELRSIREELRELRAARPGAEPVPAADAPVAPAPAAPPAPSAPPARGAAAEHGGKSSPPPAQRTVNIEIESNPPGATVFVADKKVGSTPLIVKAPTGTDELRMRLEKAGYRPRLMNVRPEEDTKISVQLAKKGD